jgi:HPt (histidine-containing phosphotransfer) domain-containing protein
MIDFEQLLTRCMGNVELARRILTIFIEATPARLQAIEASLAASLRDDVRRGAHALVGASGNIGALEVQKAAAELESIAMTADGEALAHALSLLRQAVHDAQRAARQWLDEGDATGRRPMDAGAGR